MLFFQPDPPPRCAVAKLGSACIVSYNFYIVYERSENKVLRFAIGLCWAGRLCREATDFFEGRSTKENVTGAALLHKISLLCIVSPVDYELSLYGLYPLIKL